METLSESEFLRRADHFLAELLDLCDERLPRGSHADLNAGVLTIDTPQGQYVLNRHAPLRQLWLSSPVSGAWHFAWQDGAWRATRAPLLLAQLVRGELNLAD